MACLLVVAVVCGVCACVWFVCVFVCFVCELLSAVVGFVFHGIVVLVCVAFSA